MYILFPFGKHEETKKYFYVCIVSYKVGTSRNKRKSRWTLEKRRKKTRNDDYVGGYEKKLAKSKNEVKNICEVE